MRKYGFIKQNKDIRDFKFKRVEGLSMLPPEIDLRPKMPQVYDQLSLGSCTANAIAASVEYCLQRIFTPSRLFIYFNERSMEGTILIDAGAIIRDGIKSVNQIGVIPEKMLPYDIEKFTLTPSQQCFDKAKEHLATVYEAVQQNEQSIKSALYHGFPVIFGFQVKSSFESASTERTGIYKPSGKVLGGHAVMIVGYNDATKAYTVRNSWGENWGNLGHFYMPYKEVHNQLISSDFWIIQAVS